MAAPAIALALLAAHAAGPDTTIVDIEDPPFLPMLVEVGEQPNAGAIAIGRVATEDLDMHCRDESGNWHRLHPNKLQTACGVAFTNWHAGNTRSGRYCDGPLAPPSSCDCWTKAERQEADERAKPVSPLA